MKSLDKIRREYEAIEIDTSTGDVEKDDVLDYFKETIQSLGLDYRDINQSIFVDESHKLLLEKMNPILKRFGFEEKSSYFFDQDIAVLRRFSSSISLYKRMYQLLEFNMTDDNCIDLARLSLLLDDKEHESTVYYKRLLESIELCSQGIVYVPDGSDDSSLVFDFFCEELYGNILADDKGKVNGVDFMTKEELLKSHQLDYSYYQKESLNSHGKTYQKTLSQ